MLNRQFCATTSTEVSGTVGQRHRLRESRQNWGRTRGYLWLRFGGYAQLLAHGSNRIDGNHAPARREKIGNCNASKPPPTPTYRTVGALEFSWVDGGTAAVVHLLHLANLSPGSCRGLLDATQTDLRCLCDFTVEFYSRFKIAHLNSLPCKVLTLLRLGKSMMSA